MKKLLLVAILVLGSIYSGTAQTVFLQNFETSATSIPSGWHQQTSSSDPTNLGWQFDTAYLPINGGLGSYYFTTDGSYFAFVNDLDNNGSRSCNYDTLYTSFFSTLGYSHLFISLDAEYWDFYESASLLASNDGGHTWTLISKLPGNINSWGHYTYNFDAFANQANIMIAITYADNCIQGAGLAIDNILVSVPTYDLDMGVTNQITNIFVQNNAPNIIQGTIYNYGGDSIAQMHLNYSIDGGPAVTDAMTSLSIEPLTSYNFSHSTPWIPSVAGYHTIKIWADNLNGGNDQ
ncbi:MAG TPA: hypothetical protein VK808_09905, partial [Bacteroidia bacterium]|nr:hypothetical protein [Bacteroidia bacterium]